MAQRDEYLLGYRRAEQERLQEQARQLADESSWLFDQFAIASGARVVEIGCGPHGCLDLLAQRVGPSGNVIGVERSDDAVQMARAMVANRASGTSRSFMGMRERRGCHEANSISSRRDSCW